MLPSLLVEEVPRLPGILGSAHNGLVKLIERGVADAIQMPEALYGAGRVLGPLIVAVNLKALRNFYAVTRVVEANLGDEVSFGFCLLGRARQLQEPPKNCIFALLIALSGRPNDVLRAKAPLPQHPVRRPPRFWVRMILRPLATTSVRSMCGVRRPPCRRSTPSAGPPDFG